ncbi:MAG: RagB/SusD family nutrient uptake outer membrane protein [Fulvivirga sp.]
MNTLRKRILILVGIFTFSGCEFTEPDNLTFIEDHEVYNNIDKIRYVLNTVYSGLPSGYSVIGASSLAAATDEAEEVNGMQAIQDFNIGNITPYSNPDDVWNKNFEAIRNAQVFLQSTDTITWKALEFANPPEYILRVGLLDQYRAEAKFLIAFFYFDLIKRYGGVPIVDTVINKNSDWVSDFPRKSFAECVEYIVSKCDEAALTLLPTQGEGSWGRATKGAALALKARTLLYAASDLYNQPGNTDPLRGYVDGNRQERWIEAAKANKVVIDLGQYSFHSQYEDLFLLGTAKSNEVIFERRFGSSNSFEKSNTPIGFQFGATGTCPTQDLVDAYEHMDDGDFNWNNPVHAANPYDNRDPRLAKTIVTNLSTFGKFNTTVELWNGGLNGKPRDRASKTGYYLRKYMDEELDLLLGETSAKQWIYFRFPEIYLNYAEAMNEAFGPSATGPATLDMTALDAINAVRTRAAVGIGVIDPGVNQQELEDKIRSERRVELAFETHRYWDARRWMIADQVIGGTVRGVNIIKEGTDSFTYSPFTVEERTWNDRLYYYPIPQGEVNKSNGVIVQNLSW